MTDNDYPRKAEALGLQGAARFRLEVDARGCVSDCEIVLSTGFDVLDKATCDLMRKNARFKPATNADGAPIPATFETQFTWALPKVPVREPTNWAATAQAVYSSEGALLSCRSSGEGNQLAVAQFCKYAFAMTPGQLRAGKADARGRYKVRLRGAGQFDGKSPALPTMPEAKYARTDMRFVISLDGRAQQCVESIQGDQLDNPCRMIFDPYSESKDASEALRSGRIAVQFEALAPDAADFDGNDAKLR
ncbi:energy transducer TonB [Sphingomonas psychrotolerans]|uniref:energy transducer TonB n=1 Tax=Sphingomonas psychrotolerans TaxID=1327635 RepID=UPI001305253D|nr:energy transducer TonB [Sphingomonas psychrotolerans]